MVWNIGICIVIVVELVLLGLLLREWFNPKVKSNSIFFIFTTFCVNFLLYIMPHAYDVIELDYKFDCFQLYEAGLASVKAYLVEGETDNVVQFINKIPVFGFAYVLGSILAPCVTVIAAIQAFTISFRNKRVVKKRLKKGTCDIVLGTSENALRYAKDGSAIVIPAANVDKDGAQRFIERGYLILQTTFSKEFLESNDLSQKKVYRILSAIYRKVKPDGKLSYLEKKYNIICPGKIEENLDHINQFILYHNSLKKKNRSNDTIKMFVEIDEDKIEIIQKEIIDKSPCQNLITTFCSNELLARCFMEEHPITEYLPKDFYEEDSSIREDVNINVIYLGFSALNREMYRQSIINNQLVCYKKQIEEQGKKQGAEYCVHPIHYHLVDKGIDEKDWLISGLSDALDEIRKEPNDKYFPIPELPYQRKVYHDSPSDKETLDKVSEIVVDENTYTYVIVDLGDTYKNIETGTKLRSLLMKNSKNNYHIFIRSETAYVEDDDEITYLGDIDDIFTHDVVVGEKLSEIAMKLNEIYTRKNREEKGEETKESKEDLWNKLNRLDKYSNLYAALNLRLKLHLLGLDYKVDDGKGSALQINADCSVSEKKQEAKNNASEDKNQGYGTYLERNRRNAMLAQEKYRWNAYLLSEGFLPMPKDEIRLMKNEDGELEIYRKDNKKKTHACLTTYSGLVKFLEKAKNLEGIEQVENWEKLDITYYENNGSMIQAMNNLMKELGCILIER